MNDNSVPISDRFLASIMYLLPFFDGIGFSIFLVKQFHLESVLGTLLAIYGSLPLQPYTGLIIFFVLLFAVVRNENVSHFVRFNTMQAVLIDIILLVVGLILRLLSQAIPSVFIVETFYNMVFLGLLATLTYSAVQSLRGIYAEIPGISDAVNVQVR